MILLRCWIVSSSSIVKILILTKVSIEGKENSWVVFWKVFLIKWYHKRLDSKITSIELGRKGFDGFWHDMCSLSTCKIYEHFELAWFQLKMSLLYVILKYNFYIRGAQFWSSVVMQQLWPCPGPHHTPPLIWLLLTSADVCYQRSFCFLLCSWFSICLLHRETERCCFCCESFWRKFWIFNFPYCF